MIILIVGENSFERSQELERIAQAATSPVERFEGTELELRQLPDLLMAATLFQDERTITIDTLSANKALWEALPEWLDRLADTTTLVLVEPKPDKRTKTYKQLLERAVVRKVEPWSDRDQGKAVAWISAQAKARSVTLSGELATHIVDRAGTDQWALFHAIDTLALLDSITVRDIDLLVEPHPRENVFRLFELLINANHAELQELLGALRLSSDPHSILALLASQAYQLAALSLAAESDNPQKDFMVHPFVASKLKGYVRRVDAAFIATLIDKLCEADLRLKTSSVDPWLVLEQAIDSVVAHRLETRA